MFDIRFFKKCVVYMKGYTWLSPKNENSLSVLSLNCPHITLSFITSPYQICSQKEN